jgi:type II secretory ATPase GspE/PulE/Tfp pilus assembly ATPase PilB-like protein
MRVSPAHGSSLSKRELIAQHAPISTLKQEAQKTGLIPLARTALEWVRTGETTLKSIARVVG